jgi:hypothetical protein
MDWETYNKLAERGIRKYGCALQYKHEREAQIGWKTEWREEIFSTYTLIRNGVRKEMNITGDSHIDRHKVAAAFTYAILRDRPLIVSPRATNPSWQIRYSNELLSVLCGIEIVRFFIRHGLHQMDPSLERRFKEYRFLWPKTGKGQESYIWQFVKELNHVTKQGRQDVFLLANIYFLLEASTLSEGGFPPVSTSLTPDGHILGTLPFRDQG